MWSLPIVVTAIYFSNNAKTCQHSAKPLHQASSATPPAKPSIAMPPAKKVMAPIQTPVEVDVNEDGNRALTEALDQMPVVAILTGLQPARAAEVGLALVDAGITILEVPLRGQAEPLVLKTIANLVAAVGDRALIGAGTVLTVEQVANVAATGAKLVVSPNLDPAVVKATKAAGLVSLPGVYTPTEALRAIDAGADGLKLFPTVRVRVRVRVRLTVYPLS